MRLAVITIPLDFIPFAGMCIVAWFKALGTARYLHEPASRISPSFHCIASTGMPLRLTVLQGEAYDS